MTGSDIVTIVATTTPQIASGLTGSLPLVLVIFGSLTALGIALHYIKRYVGRKG